MDDLSEGEVAEAFGGPIFRAWRSNVEGRPVDMVWPNYSNLSPPVGPVALSHFFLNMCVVLKYVNFSDTSLRESDIKVGFKSSMNFVKVFFS